MHFLYILHFNVPFGHAVHYCGSTSNLPKRLQAHASGAGSKLCRELHKAGAGWTLAAVYETNRAHLRRAERMLKDSHHVARYCPTCTPQLTAMIPGCVFWEPECLGIPLSKAFTLKEMRKQGKRPKMLMPHDVSFRLVRPNDGQEVADFIRQLMRKDGDNLGFIPIGRGLAPLVGEKGGQFVIANNDGEDVGYALFTNGEHTEKARVHQVVIRDEDRLKGYGRRLVQDIQTRVNTAYPGKILHCQVKDGIAANDFWEEIGFIRIGKMEHATSGKLLNVYERSGSLCKRSPSSAS